MVKVFKVFQDRAVKARGGVGMDRRETGAAHRKNQAILEEEKEEG